MGWWKKLRRRKKNYSQLSTAERKEISHFKQKSYSLRSIAKFLKRAVSTITYEISKRKKKNGHYDPLPADWNIKHRVRVMSLRKESKNILRASMVDRLRRCGRSFFQPESLRNDSNPEALSMAENSLKSGRGLPPSGKGSVMLKRTSFSRANTDAAYFWPWLTGELASPSSNEFWFQVSEIWNGLSSGSRKDFRKWKRLRPTTICSSNITSSWRSYSGGRSIFVTRTILGRKARSRERTKRFENIFPKGRTFLFTPLILSKELRPKSTIAGWKFWNLLLPGNFC